MIHYSFAKIRNISESAKENRKKFEMVIRRITVE